ncbi:unnamed protein product [Diamesa serratosioi]
MRVTIGLIVLCLAVSAFADVDRFGRIVGGEVASPHQHPYLVGIIRRLSATATGVCGGSILTNFVILTSAQCLQGTLSVEMVMGAQVLGINEALQERVTVLPSGYRIHAQYNPTTMLNNIATAIMPTAVIFKPHIQPSLLPFSIEADLLWDGISARVAGWGRISPTAMATELRFISNVIITNAQCAAVHGALIQPTTLCTATSIATGSICSGDSGSPLVLQQRSRRIQVGIANIDESADCFAGLPARYTRVAPYLSWIAANKV